MNAISSITAGATATQQPASSATGTNSINSELTPNSFLSLLTTQLQNQDPMNPEDPTQFMNQLVQFNQLEQLIQINQTLQTNSASAAGQSSANSSSNSSANSTTPSASSN